MLNRSDSYFYNLSSGHVLCSIVGVGLIFKKCAFPAKSVFLLVFEKKRFFFLN